MGVYKRLALVALALWAVGTLIVASVMARGDTRRAALDAMLNDLDAVKAERRIVLVGSSNVVFGLSAGRLMESSGIPARNAAVNAGRPAFSDYFSIVMDRVHPNDVVVVSGPLWIFAESGSQPYGCKDPSGLRCLVKSWKPVPRLFDFVHKRQPNQIFRWPKERTREGDVVFPQDRDTKRFLPVATTLPTPRFSERSARMAKEQIEMIRARGACPVIAFPPLLVLDGARTKWEQEFERAKAAFKAAGLDDVLVGSMMIQTDPHHFFNDAHHMSFTGRETWTQMVLEDLRKTKRCGVNWDVARAGQ